MKNVIKLLVLVMTTVGFAQSNNLDGDDALDNVKINAVNVSVSVDSVEDLKSTFDVKDIEELASMVEPNEALSFEIICKNKSSFNESTSLTYKVKGNSNDIEDFIKRVQKVRKAAIKYYKN